MSALGRKPTLRVRCGRAWRETEALARPRVEGELPPTAPRLSQSLADFEDQLAAEMAAFADAVSGGGLG